MLVLAVAVVIAAGAGAIAWWVLARWSPELAAPHLERATVETTVDAHPRARSWLERRRDPAVLTGAALTAAVALVVVGVAAVGILVLIVRAQTGLRSVDLAGARFGASHATSTSTRVLRLVTQLGGAVALVPLTALFAVLASRRQPARSAIIGFLAVCVGGQFAVANLVKLSVDRARPSLDRLTGFSGSSFPSGHATAAAAAFAAMALVAGRGRGRGTRAALGAVAAAGATLVATSRVLLGVHWITDVVAGLSLGWTWFALTSIAFGGRLLHFGAPAEAAEDAAAAPVTPDVSNPTLRGHKATDSGEK